MAFGDAPQLVEVKDADGYVLFFGRPRPVRPEER